MKRSFRTGLVLESPNILWVIGLYRKKKHLSIITEFLREKKRIHYTKIIELQN